MPAISKGIERPVTQEAFYEKTVDLFFGFCTVIHHRAGSGRGRSPQRRHARLDVHPLWYFAAVRVSFSERAFVFKRTK